MTLSLYLNTFYLELHQNQCQKYQPHLVMTTFYNAGFSLLTGCQNYLGSVFKIMFWSSTPKGFDSVGLRGCGNLHFQGSPGDSIEVV